jgi:hypothetical protein
MLAADVQVGKSLCKGSSVIWACLQCRVTPGITEWNLLFQFSANRNLWISLVSLSVTDLFGRDVLHVRVLAKLKAASFMSLLRFF